MIDIIGYDLAKEGTDGTVFLVWSGYGSGEPYLEGVFGSQEKAQIFIDENKVEYSWIADKTVQ